MSDNESVSESVRCVSNCPPPGYVCHCYQTPELVRLTDAEKDALVDAVNSRRISVVSVVERIVGERLADTEPDDYPQGIGECLHCGVPEPDEWTHTCEGCGTVMVRTRAYGETVTVNEPMPPEISAPSLFTAAEKASRSAAISAGAHRAASAVRCMDCWHVGPASRAGDCYNCGGPVTPAYPPGSRGTGADG